MFEDIILKQEQVFVSGDNNWRLFWTIVFIGILIGVVLAAVLCIMERNFVDYWLGFLIFPFLCFLASAGIGSGVSSSTHYLVNKVYETHYTVEAETFYKSEFTKDYEIVSQDGRLLVVREVPNE